MHLVGLMRKNKKMALLMPLKERQKLFDHFHTALLHFAVHFITEEEKKQPNAANNVFLPGRRS